MKAGGFEPAACTLQQGTPHPLPCLQRMRRTARSFLHFLRAGQFVMSCWSSQKEKWFSKQAQRKAMNLAMTHQHCSNNTDKGEQRPRQENPLFRGHPRWELCSELLGPYPSVNADEVFQNQI